MRNDLLAAIVSALNGSVTNMNNRNKLLADIVLALGGTVTNIDNRNMLLMDILNAINTESGGDGTAFLDGSGRVSSTSIINQNSEIWSVI